MASAPIDLNLSTAQATGHDSAPAAQFAASSAGSYMPALDGLRALAVLAVIFYHANLPPWLPGGFLGVECFFVISGFLITSLLLAEWERDGRLNFKAFWLRRARRLLPALFLLLIGVLTYCVIFLPGEVAALRRDAGAAAVYVSNWYLIFSHQSYFEAVGRPPLLRHLWSLAVEEQFYLLWPLIFSGLMLVNRAAGPEKRRRVALLIIIAGALASTALMAALYQPLVDPSRPYYGTDTRAAGLLIGAALALLWAPARARQSRRSSTAIPARALDVPAAESVAAAAVPESSQASTDAEVTAESPSGADSASTALPVGETAPSTSAGLELPLAVSVAVEDQSPAESAAEDGTLALAAASETALAASVTIEILSPDETAAVGNPPGISSAVSPALATPVDAENVAAAETIADNSPATSTEAALATPVPMEPQLLVEPADISLAPSPAVEAVPSVVADQAPAPDRAFRVRGSASLLLDGVGLLALAGLFAAFIGLDEFQSFLYLGGFGLVSLATAGVILASVDARARVLPRVLGWGPLRWIGLRSYGLYLWHWPVFQLTRPQIDLPLDGLPLFALRMAITLLVVEFSYRLIEMPVRQGVLGRAWRGWRAASGERRTRLTIQWATAACVLLVFGAVLGNSVAGAQPPPPPDYLAALAAPLPGDATLADPTLGDPAIGDLSAGTPAPAPLTSPLGVPGTPAAGGPSPTPTAALVTVERLAGYAPPAGWPAGLRPVVLEIPLQQMLAAAESHLAASSASVKSGSPSTGAPAGATPAAGAAPSRPLTLTLAQPAPFTSPLPPGAAVQAPVTSTTATLRITAIGDSVMRGAAPQLLAAMPGMEIDAPIGRLPWHVADVVKAHIKASTLRSVVVIHTGGNGLFTAQMLDQVMALLADRKRVVFLTVKVPREWESYNNRMLAANVGRYSNAVLLDWRADSLNHPEWFWGDAIHLREDGAKDFARLIANAVFAP